MLTGQTSFSQVIPHLRLVKMLRKPLLGIRKATEQDYLACVLRIYNCKQLKCFMI